MPTISDSLFYFRSYKQYLPSGPLIRINNEYHMTGSISHLELSLSMSCEYVVPEDSILHCPAPMFGYNNDIEIIPKGSRHCIRSRFVNMKDMWIIYSYIDKWLESTNL